MQIKRIFKSECFFSHNIVEVLFRDLSAISRSSLKHLLKFIKTHGLSKLFSYSFNIININETSSIIIKKIKNFINTSLYK
jgi:hypothetical protein